MKKYIWWVVSDQLDFGTYCQTLAAALRMQALLCVDGATDVKIEMDEVLR